MWEACEMIQIGIRIQAKGDQMGLDSGFANFKSESGFQSPGEQHNRC